MRAVNRTNRKELACNVAVANNLLSRMRGLLGRSTLPAGEALLIQPCNSIHTFGMRFPIDVIFLNGKNEVVAVKKSIVPNRMTSVYFKAKSVLELPAGVLDATATRVGDEVEIV